MHLRSDCYRASVKPASSGQHKRALVPQPFTSSLRAQRCSQASPIAAASVKNGGTIMEAPSLTTNHKPQHWSSILLAALVTANVAGAVSMPPALAAAPDTIVGPARVVDGDTLYIGNDKFRLYGVDAPESKQTCVNNKGQSYACGLVSKDALAQKVGNQPVSCKRKQVDQYGRSVAVCSLLPGNMLGAALGQQEEDLNRWMVDNGFAVAYREYSKDYIASEEAAKAAHKGIWAGSFEYPAQWRKEEKAGVPHPPLLPPPTFVPPPPPPMIAALPPLPAPAAAPAPASICGPGVQPIKGNISSKGIKIYHVPGGPYYDSVLVEPEKGESYFCSETAAAAAGFRPVAGK